MHRVRIADIPWQEMRSPRGNFRSSCRNISLALGGIRNGGTWCGGHPFDVQIRKVPAGASICPFHSHVAQWELFVVLAGTATIRAGGETHTATVGECFVHPPGEPHQLLNHTDADLEVLIIADNPVLDAFHYPDSNKWGLRPPGKYFRMVEVDYFDGEEEPLENAPPYQPASAPPPPAITPFAQRKLHPDSLTWEEWTSPKKKFQGASKEISPALGAKWNTAVGLGGHPFDLELNKVAPGACPCPYHSHAAEWEMFYILSGTATVRAGAETHTVAAGEVVIHPPGEAHQISNASATEELYYYIIADNSPVEYWGYPDSGKWGFRGPRMHFRTISAPYYDGEE